MLSRVFLCHTAGHFKVFSYSGTLFPTVSSHMLPASTKINTALTYFMLINVENITFCHVDCREKMNMKTVLHKCDKYN